MSETTQNSISAMVNVEDSSIKSIKSTTLALKELSKEAKTLQATLSKVDASEHKLRRNLTTNLNSVRSRIDELGGTMKGRERQQYQRLLELGAKNGGRVVPQNMPLGSFPEKQQKLLIKATEALTNPNTLKTLTKNVDGNSVPYSSAQRREIVAQARLQAASLAEQQKQIKLHTAAISADRKETIRAAKARQNAQAKIDSENRRTATNNRIDKRYRTAVQQNERDLIAKALKNNGDFTGGKALAAQDKITQKRWIKLQEKLSTPEFQSTLRGSKSSPAYLSSLNQNLNKLNNTFAESTAQAKIDRNRLASARRASLKQGLTPPTEMGAPKAVSSKKAAPLSMADMGQRSRLASRERMFGDGGAHLFKTQGAVLGNYALMGAGIGGIAAAVQFTIELDKAFKQLQSIVSLTDTEMQGLETTLINVSEKTKFTAVEVAAAATVLGQAGYGKDQIEKAIEPITLFATAVGTDLKQAVELGTSVMGIFSMEASQLGDVANIMTTAINKSKLTMDKLSLGLQYSGNLAAQSGVDFKELVSLLGAMANSGIKSGSMLGTGFRQVLISLQAPTDKFKSRLKELNLSLSDLDVRTHGMVNVLKTLTNSGFTSADAMDVLETRSAAAFSAMVNNLDVADALGRSMGVTESAAEANATQMTALANQWDRLRSVALSIGAETFEPMTDALTNVMRLTADLLGNFKEINGAVESLQVVGAAIAGYGLVKAMTWLSTLVAALYKSRGPGLGVGIGYLGAGVGGQLGTATTGMANRVGPTVANAALASGGRMAALRGAGALLGPWGVGLGAAASVAYSAFGTPDGPSDVERYRTQANADGDKYSSASANVKRVDQALNTIYQRSGLSDEAMTVEINKIADSFRDLNFTLSTVGGTTEQAIEDFKKLKEGLLLEASVASDNKILNLQNLADAQQTSINESSSALSRSALGKRRGRRVSGLEVGRDGTAPTNYTTYSFADESITALKAASDIGRLSDTSADGLRGYSNKTIQAQSLLQKQLLAIGKDPTRESETALLTEVLAKVQSLSSDVSKRIETSNQIIVQEISKENDEGVSILGSEFSQRITELQREGVERSNNPLFKDPDKQLEQARLARKDEEELTAKSRALMAEIVAYGKDNGLSMAAVNKANQPLLGFEANVRTRTRAELEEAKPQELARIDGETIALKKIRTEVEAKMSNTADQDAVKEYELELNSLALSIQDLAFQRAVLNLKNTEGYSEAYSNAEQSNSETLAATLRSNRELAQKNLDRLNANRVVEDVFNGASFDASARRVGDSEFKKAFEKRLGADSNRGNEAKQNILAKQEGVNLEISDTNYLLSRAQSRAGDGGLSTAERVAQNKLSVSLLAKQNELQQQLLDLEQEALEAQKTITEQSLAAAVRVMEGANPDSEAGRVAALQVAKLKGEIAVLNKSLGKTNVKRSVQEVENTDAQAVLNTQGYFLPSNRSLYSNEERRRIGAGLSGQSYLTDTGNVSEQYQDKPMGVVDQVLDQTSAQFEGFDMMTEATLGLQSVVDGLGDSLASVFSSILSGTKSGSEAFKAMGAAIASDMLAMSSKMLSNQLLKSLLGYIMGGFGGTAMGGTFSGMTDGTQLAYTGGEVRGYASGGLINSGISSRDSTLIHAAKGEFVVRKEAVDAVGTDSLKSINNLNRNSVKNYEKAASNREKASTMFSPQVNTSVYMLDKTTPPPSMGANEVLAVITDDMIRSGKTRTLVKQISTGQL